MEPGTVGKYGTESIEYICIYIKRKKKKKKERSKAKKKEKIKASHGKASCKKVEI